jgi:hypothetical protein
MSKTSFGTQRLLLSSHTKQWSTYDDKDDRTHVPPLLSNYALSWCDQTSPNKFSNLLLSFFSPIPPHFQDHVWTFWTRNKVHQMTILENDFSSLYVVIRTIAFDMQYCMFYPRGALSVDIMSNLFSRNKGDTILNISNKASPCNILPLMTCFFFTNNYRSFHWASLQNWPLGR